MAQRLSEQVVEWLTVGGNAFTPQTSVPLVVSQPGKTVTVPTTAGTSLGAYINQAQLWVLGAAAASTNVKSSQIVVSSSDAGSGGSVALELWRGTAASWQLLDNGGIFYISNNYTDSAQTSYTNNLSMRYGAVADQYTHLHSTKDSSYAYSAGGAALSVAGGATFAKKVYINDTTDSNYATVAGSFVTMGGAYIKKKTYIADTTDASSTSTGSFSTAGGASIAKKLYVGSNFYQTGDTAQIASNNIVFRNKSINNSQAGSNPYITGLTIGDGSEITLDEYKDGYLSIHSKSGLLIYPTNSTRPAVYDATKTYSVGTIVWYSNDYYRCTTAITEAQGWTAANWTKLPVAAGAMWVHGNVNPTITNTYTLGTASYRWSKLYIGSADSYGSGTQPIYWSSGVPTASTSTVGSGVKPIYLSSGTLTVSSSSLGGTAKPIYMDSGELKAISATVGSGVKPIYLSSGTLTVSSSTVGSGVKPIYLSSGEITVSSSTVGGTAQPVYLSSGEIKGISATVGSVTGAPVYLNAGTITVMTDINMSKSNTAETYVRTTNSNGAVEILASTNRGLYDRTNSKWIVYTVKAADHTYIPLWASKGSATHPVYFNSSGEPVATTYSLSATINAGTAGRFAYYSGVDTISATEIMRLDTADILVKGSGSSNNARFAFYKSDDTYYGFFGFSQNGSHYGIYNTISNFYPVDILSNGNTTGVFNGLAAQTGNATHIISPSGGHYTSRASSVTGALKITLPVGWTNVMVSFFVDIFDYTNKSRATYYISGYNYSTDGKWYNNVAKSIVPAGDKGELNVRMCYDGSKCCVTIGETNTAWSYPQVCVRDVYIGYAGSNITDTWKKDWSISFITSLPSTVSELLNTYEYAASLPTTNLYKARVFFKTI